MEKLNYEKDAKIDFDNLDIEWIEQADLARRYGKHLSELRKKVAQLEEKKKTKRSELIDKINRDPEAYTSKPKPNATDIEAAYRRQEEYKETVQEALDAQEELDYAELVYQEISWTRKKALENLVTLHGQMYFAGPSMPRNLKQEMEKRREHQKQTTSRSIGKKANVKRRREEDEG